MKSKGLVDKLALAEFISDLNKRISALVTSVELRAKLITKQIRPEINSI